MSEVFEKIEQKEGVDLALDNLGDFSRDRSLLSEIVCQLQEDDILGENVTYGVCRILDDFLPSKELETIEV